jgi:hypothetical protein
LRVLIAFLSISFYFLLFLLFPPSSEELFENEDEDPDPEELEPLSDPLSDPLPLPDPLEEDPEPDELEDPEDDEEGLLFLFFGEIFVPTLL